MVDVPWWVICAVVLVVLFILHEIREFDYFKKQGIPYLKPHIVIGSALNVFKKGVIPVELEAYEKHRENGLYGEFMGVTPALVVYDEKMLSEIMVKEFSTFPNRLVLSEPGTLPDLMVFNQRDEHWRHTRQEMSPTFTTGKLKKMNSEINRCARTFAQNLCAEAEAGREIEAKEFAGGYSMDVIASTAFGIQVDSQNEKNNVFVKNAKRVFNGDIFNISILLQFYFPKMVNFLRKLGFSFDPFSKEANEFFCKITKDTMEMRKTDEDQSRCDFLQLMIKAQRGEDIRDQGDNDDQVIENANLKGLSTEEILANASLFFVAGYDTTSTSLGFFMYNMATNPECQEKLVDEIDRVIGDRDMIDYSLLQEMPYLDKCINENLRLFPPAIRLNRIANKNITINGVLIRKGMAVSIPVFAIHRDSKKWPEPEKFDPERFSPENKKDRNPYHFLPFGYGPRNCLGMRMALQGLKIAVVHLLKDVTFKPCEKTKIPPVFDKSFMLKMDGGIWLKVEKRNNK